MIIGLTGKNGAGKGEVVKFLAESGYATHSLSDILRDELKARKRAITRENLITMGNELRATYGASVLAERTLKRLPLEANAVVDSIRNPFEVEALRQRNDFFLIAVIADPKIRFERTKQRARENDATTFEQFLEFEARETTSSDPKVQQLDKTEALADAKIPNNGTIEELHQHARKVVNQLSAKLERPDWDQYFMGIARVAALRSNCIKRRVAAVIVRDQRVISTGYNGTPRGIKNCNEGGCPRCNGLGTSGVGLDECLCSHAEENAIVQAAFHGASLKDATLYTTLSPCLMCTKMIINSGIREVVFNATYTIAEVPLRLLKEARVTVRQITNH